MNWEREAVIGREVNAMLKYSIVSIYLGMFVMEGRTGRVPSLMPCIHNNSRQSYSHRGAC